MTSDYIKNLDVNCISRNSVETISEKRDVVIESPLTIEIKNVGAYTIMSTPCDKLALAMGFCFSEGIINGPGDIGSCMQCPDDPSIIRIQLIEKQHGDTPKRNLLIVSSCGICGSEDIEKTLNSLPIVPDTLILNKEQLTALPKQLRQNQKLFKQTGGTHAAALMWDNKLIAVCEDIGRHNAFDKAIGMCLLQSIPTRGAAAVLSGRISVELVFKAARAGIELIAAVSAPTTLAIQAARKCNITLCGFVRGAEATIYCHPRRIN